MSVTCLSVLGKQERH